MMTVETKLLRKGIGMGSKAIANLEENKLENNNEENLNVIAQTSIKVTDEETARARFHEIGKRAMRNKPVKPEIHELGEVLMPTVSILATVSLIAPAIAFGIGAPLVGAILTFLIASSWTTIFMVDSYNGLKTSGVKAFLSRIFLSKRKRELRLSQGSRYSKYLQTQNIYMMLVQKAKQQLHDEKVFELVNHGMQDKFIHISSSGEFQTLSQSEWAGVTNTDFDEYDALNSRIVNALAEQAPNLSQEQLDKLTTDLK